MNEIIESLYNRKSVRVYEEKAIPNEMKNVILEAAMQAPTAVLPLAKNTGISTII